MKLNVKFIPLFAFFGVLMASPNLEGQIVSVKVDFEKDSILIGEQVDMRLVARAERDLSLELPQFTTNVTKSIEVLAGPRVDTLIENDSLIITQNYRVTSFEPGWNTVPPIPVVFTSSAISDTLYTTAELITVLLPDVDTTAAIKPIKAPINTPVTFKEMLPWILLGFGILILAIAGYLVYRRYASKETTALFKKDPPEPPHVIAMQRLDKMKASKMAETGEVKLFYSELTDIIRHYIAGQFFIHALESTTEELLEAFRGHPVSTDDLERSLSELLNLADLVKFAKEDPLKQENQEKLELAVAFVKETYMGFMNDQEKEDSDA